MPLLPRTLPAGFIAPCLPSSAPQAPSGEERLHEIKHDGFRVIARKEGKRVKLYSRPGNDLTDRFPLIVEALARLSARSCIITKRAGREAGSRGGLGVVTTLRAQSQGPGLTNRYTLCPWDWGLSDAIRSRPSWASPPVAT
jgi:bifunctional non-homologous end joining protein LigD